VHKFLVSKLENQKIIEYLIVQEVHEDGNFHLHCYIELEKRCNFHTANCLDILEYHGNYQTTKKKESWIEYLLKADKEPLCSRDWKIWLTQSKTHQKRTNNIEKLELVESKGLARCVREGDISLVQLPQYEKAYNLLKTLEAKDDREEIGTRLENPWDVPLPFDLDLKQCHYWIYSRKSNYGKTTWVQSILKQFRAQLWNTEEKFQAHIVASTQIIIFDEYTKKTCLMIGTLNTIMDGTVSIQAKGMNSWKLNEKPLVLIVSNFSPIDIYCNTPNLPNLMSRITVINLEDNHPGFN
jgi:hypothetical protein